MTRHSADQSERFKHSLTRPYFTSIEFGRLSHDEQLSFCGLRFPLPRNLDSEASEFRLSIRSNNGN